VILDDSAWRYTAAWASKAIRTRLKDIRVASGTHNPGSLNWRVFTASPRVESQESAMDYGSVVVADLLSSILGAFEAMSKYRLALSYRFLVPMCLTHTWTLVALDIKSFSFTIETRLFFSRIQLMRFQDIWVLWVVLVKCPPLMFVAIATCTLCLQRRTTNV
jgi:hypothetical protein